MPDIQIIQPTDMDISHFVFDDTTKKWRLAKPAISADADNALTSGSDGGPMIGNDKLKKYRLVQDAAAGTASLYEYNEGQAFDVSTATPIDTISLNVVNAQVDDVAIVGQVLTFTDAQSGLSITFDVDSPIYEILAAQSYSIAVSGTGKNTPLTIDLIVDPNVGNLLKITTTGARVDENDILAIINQSVNGMTFVHNPELSTLAITIGNTSVSVQTSRLLDSSGNVLGYLIS